jgi:hypothetical protein
MIPWELVVLFFFTVLLSRGCILDTTTTTTQTSRELLTVGPDMAKVLAVVTLREAILSSV